ncbi:RTA1 like protein-domain-containing protein [Truncatella angustata]|uniref:RTA1 like protein-domain-containing protein n=1 Tax=Truncatella angustata TaxID=152316 RepID=A0A9P9A2F3_9PEZI|nr:RTA1 like protein-domain-containing protein [Truncatella angustata]KAH6658146.1 RTA1 like protein-domain-containing protein [Truncatella angustata]
MASSVRYQYTPSLAAAVIFIILFGLSSLSHIFQLIKYRTWYFIPFLLGCLFETVGYIGRGLSATESPNWTLPPYIIQALLLLLAPALFSASIYMILGRLIRLLDGEKFSVIRTKWMTAFFLLGDIASFLGQAMGASKLKDATTSSERDQAQWIIIVALLVQIAFFGFFLVVAGIFHRRIMKNPTTRSFSITQPWRQCLLVLYCAGIFIMVRSVFRVLEYSMGKDGELQSKEIYLYIFDATLMIIVSIGFNIFHPSRTISDQTVDCLPLSSSTIQLEVRK